MPRDKANLKLLLFFALPQQLLLLQPGKLHLRTTTRECRNNKRKTSNNAHHLVPLLLPANFLTLSDEFSRQNLFDESDECEIKYPPVTDFFLTNSNKSSTPVHTSSHTLRANRNSCHLAADT
jgi:hypothetical protein